MSKKEEIEKEYQATKRRRAAARAIDVADRNAELAKRLGISEFKTSQAGSTEKVTPEIIAEASRFVNNFLKLCKNWYERLDSQEKRKVDPYWVSYKDRVSVIPGKAPFSTRDYFRRLAEKHYLFFRARDDLFVPNDGSILNALCKAAFSTYSEWEALKADKARLQVSLQLSKAPSSASPQWEYVGLPLKSAPAVLVRGFGKDAQFALASQKGLIEESVKTIVLLSGQNTRVPEARLCDECDEYKKALWRYSRSNRGPVSLCERCKQIVYGRSLASVNSGLPARAVVSGGAFEMNRRRH